MCWMARSTLTNRPLFVDDLQVSHNPMSSFTTPSAVIVPGPKVMT